jgi:hypothetical protein
MCDKTTLNVIAPSFTIQYKTSRNNKSQKKAPLMPSFTETAGYCNLFK